MDIDAIQSNQGANIFYTEGLRSVFMDHLTYLRTHQNTYLIEIEPNLALKYTGDLFGLLRAKNFNPDYYWIIMKVNNIDNPTQCDETLASLLIPPKGLIESIKNVYNSKKS